MRTSPTRRNGEEALRHHENGCLNINSFLLTLKKYLLTDFIERETLIFVVLLIYAFIG